MAELAVTAVGVDRPGIVAAVAEVLHARGGNVEDSAMTILGGHFAIVLVVSSDDTPEELRDALLEATAELDLTVSVSLIEVTHSSHEPTHLLSVYGADRPGILAGVSRTLADLGVNITDLETRLLGTEEEPIYAMIIEVVAADPDGMEAAVGRVCDDLGVDHTVRPIDAQTF